MEKIVVIINGYPGAGKDTFVDFCKERSPYTGNVHTSKPAKMAAKLLGWNDEKNYQSRAFLASLVYQSYNLFDGPTNYVLEIVRRTGAAVTFVHSREPDRIDHLKDKLQEEGIRVVTLFIIRNVEQAFSNHADENVWRYKYDKYIDNNGTLDELKINAVGFMDKLIQQGGDKK